MKNRIEIDYIWRVGDTTVRNPRRSRGALVALSKSPLNGNMLDGDSKNEFAKLLHNEGVVDWKGVVNGNNMKGDASKWCLALSRLGFITPRLTPKRHMNGPIDPLLKSIVKGIDGLSGRPYEITPAGRQLINCKSKLAEQECYLRALICYRAPSPIDLTGSKTYEEMFRNSFFPLKFILRIIHGLRESGENPIITAREYALLVQTVSPDDRLERIVGSIIEYRIERKGRKGDAEKYDQELASRIALRTGKDKLKVLKDLDTRAHCALMHFRSTGVFKTSFGRGVEVARSHEALSNLLRNRYIEINNFEDFVRVQINGAGLPTDDKRDSLYVIQDLKKKIEDLNVKYDIVEVNDDMSIQYINGVRNDLEEKYHEIMEIEYAKNQPSAINEILGYLKSIPKNDSFRMLDGTNVSYTRGERATYLEWAVWRAFLAIGGLQNSPKDARRFEVDHDFMPIHFAPGGGPDMYFEFDNAVVVVEVTLTESSRQEAAEGEPVRRHVATYFEKFDDKSVYGLFIAPKIDSNTAQTFLDGIWFLPDDSRIDLDIVPVSLDAFIKFLRSAHNESGMAHEKLLRLMHECRELARREREAPRWKSAVSSQFIHAADEDQSAKTHAK